MTKKIIIISFIVLVLCLIGLKSFSAIDGFLLKQQQIHLLQEKGGMKLVIQVDVQNVPVQQKATAVEADKQIISKRLVLLGLYPFIQTTSDNKIIVQLANTSNLNEITSLIGSNAQLTFLEEGRTIGLSGGDVQSASVVYGTQEQPEVHISFTDKGKRLLADVTTNSVGKTLTIMLDKQILETAKISQPILTGEAIISGSLTDTQAKNLAILLDAGAIPAPYTVISKQYLKPGVIINE